MIERRAIPDRATWLAWRAAHVTANPIGALLGCHEYVTAFQLYMLKAGLTVEDPEETAPMRRGRLLEAPAVELLKEDRPEWEVLERGGFYYCQTEWRIGATPDVVVRCRKRGKGVVQIKSVEPSIFHRKWKRDDVFEPPLWIVLQAITEAELTGATWAAIGALVVSFGIDLHIIEIPIHRPVMERLREEVRAFWRRIAENDPPPHDYARDGETIAALYQQDSGTEIDLTGDNRIIAIAGENATLRDEISVRKKQREALRAEALAKLGPHARGLIDGRVLVTAKTITSKGHYVPPNTYRAVRFSKGALDG